MISLFDTFKILTIGHIAGSLKYIFRNGIQFTEIRTQEVVLIFNLVNSKITKLNDSL